MSGGNLGWLLTVPACLLAGLVFTVTAPPSEEHKMTQTVVDVLAMVEENYYRKLDAKEKKKLVEAMINGGLRSLDDHSAFYNEDALSRFRNETQGEFGGVGMHMQNDPEAVDESLNRYLVVGSPMPGTPAYDAGIGPGDIILKVKDEASGKEESTKGKSIEQIRKVVVGAPGTQVTLTMIRGSNTHEEQITLTRALIQQHAIYGYSRLPSDPDQWNFFPDPASKIAMIRIETFSDKTTPELKAALAKIMADGAKGLILDLRGNGGGLLNEAIDVCDLFLAGGDIVSTRFRDKPEPTRKWTAKNDKSPYENRELLPMAVLIDRNSASASEIVAAALKDNGRAVIIGERTFGKGSVQKVYPLPSDDKQAVKLTSETWHSPGGLNMHRGGQSNPWKPEDTENWGVRPSDSYKLTLSFEDQKNQFLDRQKIDIIPAKPGSPPRATPKKPPPAMPPGWRDPYLDKAFDYFRKAQGGAAIPKAGIAM